MIFFVMLCFKNFEVLGPADRILVYMTLWIQKCLAVSSQASNFQDAKRQLEALANADQPGPGHPNFVLAPLFTKATGTQEADVVKNYFKQLRQETVARVLPLFYPDGGPPNKWWFQFNKKKFMNYTL